MQKFNSLHIVILICWFLISKRNKTETEPVKDLVRDTFYLPYFEKTNGWILWILTLCPIYFFFSNDDIQQQLPSIFEHMIVVYITILCISTIKLFANPSTQIIDYQYPLLVLIMLNLLFNNIISRNQTILVYVYIIVFKYVQMMSNKKYTTSAAIDDLILTHLLFFLMK